MLQGVEQCFPRDEALIFGDKPDRVCIFLAFPLKALEGETRNPLFGAVVLFSRLILNLISSP